MGVSDWVIFIIIVLLLFWAKFQYPDQFNSVMGTVEKGVHWLFDTVGGLIKSAMGGTSPVNATGPYINQTIGGGG